jgi:hypothetical protein
VTWPDGCMLRLNGARRAGLIWASGPPPDDGPRGGCKIGARASETPKSFDVPQLSQRRPRIGRHAGVRARVEGSCLADSEQLRASDLFPRAGWCHRIDWLRHLVRPADPPHQYGLKRNAACAGPLPCGADPDRRCQAARFLKGRTWVDFRDEGGSPRVSASRVSRHRPSRRRKAPQQRRRSAIRRRPANR